MTREKCYIMRRLCRRSKNLDGPDIESLCCVITEVVSSLSHGMYWSMLLVADVNCRVWGCLNAKRDLETAAFSRMLYLCIL